MESQPIRGQETRLRCDNVGSQPIRGQATRSEYDNPESQPISDQEIRLNCDHVDYKLYSSVCEVTSM